MQGNDVRKIRELKTRKHLSWYTMQMAAINRKQVPLCREHHTKLHHDKLTPIEKLMFSAGCNKLIGRKEKPKE
jgi:hypothetical protein